jgi:hypothetical protein
MITEDYVSFETAKLLKEKGFDEKCLHYYEDNRHRDEGIKFSDWCNIEYSNSEIGRRFTCPTLQMAMKWLREVHNIDISIIPLRSHKEYLPRIESDTISYDAIPCRKYEEACEVAIKYCLEKLI